MNALADDEEFGRVYLLLTAVFEVLSRTGLSNSQRNRWWTILPPCYALLTSCNDFRVRYMAVRITSILLNLSPKDTQDLMDSAVSRESFEAVTVAR